MGYPKTVTGVRKFIGATGYFRRFIKNYGRIAKPLNNLIGCDNAKMKNHPVMLLPEAKDTFNTLKQKCMTAPVLAFADLEKPFLLETDASALGLGAVYNKCRQMESCIQSLTPAVHSGKEKRTTTRQNWSFGTESGQLQNNSENICTTDRLQ